MNIKNYRELEISIHSNSLLCKEPSETADRACTWIPNQQGAAALCVFVREQSIKYSSIGKVFYYSMFSANGARKSNRQKEAISKGNGKRKSKKGKEYFCLFMFFKRSHLMSLSIVACGLLGKHRLNFPPRPSVMLNKFVNNFSPSMINEAGEKFSVFKSSRNAPNTRRMAKGLS